MQGKLGRFADGTAKDQHHSQGQNGGMQVGTGCIHSGEAGGAGGNPEKQDAEHEAEVSDTVDEEGLFGGIGCRILAEVVADQDVGAHTDQFPKHEHHHQIVSHDDAEHREEEE